MIISDCMAVGFPRWTADEEARQYLTKQIEGYIRTADSVRMGQDGGADGQLLPLTIDWRAGDQRVPVPVGQLDAEPANPWSGMSGAVVTASDSVIGVIHSHNRAARPDVLTVTPLLALTQLPAPKQRQFCDALGIPDLNVVPMLNGRNTTVLHDLATVDEPGWLPGSASPAPVFSDEVQDYWQDELAKLGVRVPPAWNYAALEWLYRDCQERVRQQGTDADLCRARDTAKALWLAAAAFPLVDQFDIEIEKLQYLYSWHVLRPPDSRALDGLLINAASVGIREQYDAAHSPGRPGDVAVTALARFMLAIASHWRARQKRPTAVDLTEIKTWIKVHLGLKAPDIDKYLTDIPKRFWALIELKTEDMGSKVVGSAAREMPTQIIVATVSDAGKVRTDPVECRPTSEADVEELLRDCVAGLPSDQFIVDLVLPRDWLDARVEHWPLCDVAGSLEPLSRKHQPHLRWAGHRHLGELARLLKERFDRPIRWEDDPENIPPDVTRDQELLRAWLDERNRLRTPDPPYFIGSSHGARDHDPLNALLLEGYGFLAWFTEEAAFPIPDAAVCIAGVSSSVFGRKDSLARQLAVNVRQYKPIIIWSEPDKREDFKMPPAKFKNPQRSARK